MILALYKRAMPWKIRKRPNHNQYKVYGERGNPLSKEWKTKTEAEKQLRAVTINYIRNKQK